MKKNKILVLSLVSMLFFLACEKPEIPILPFDRGDIVTSEVSMGTDYMYQIYFDLETNTVVRINSKSDWDISYECSAVQRLYINTSKFMFVWNTGQSEFSAVTDTAGFFMNSKTDVSSGNTDSTGFGELEVNTVYMIDRGKSELGLALGFLKFMITNIDTESVEFTYSELDGGEVYSGVIEKNALYNTHAYSFNTHEPVFIEPEKTKYDLVFTQYTYQFTDPPIPYLVTGVLMNKFNTKAILFTEKSFTEITLADTALVELSAQTDVIGYNWKYYDFDAAQFLVDETMNYIIQTSTGLYYKLHFIDFYSQEGEKGNPVFEFQLL